MGDITTRVITGFFFLIVMIGGVVLSEYSFLILFSLLVVLCINEYHGIIHNLLTSTIKWKTTYKIINTIFSVVIFGIVFLVASNKIPLISWSLVCGFPLTWLVIEMYTKSEKPFYNVCLNSMAIFYLAIPLSSASLLAFHAGEYSWHYLLAIMFFAWSNDSFAYLAGRFLGKHKLFERISPKKTWEGFSADCWAPFCLPMSSLCCFQDGRDTMSPLPITLFWQSSLRLPAPMEIWRKA